MNELPRIKYRLQQLKELLMAILAEPQSEEEEARTFLIAWALIVVACVLLLVLTGHNIIAFFVSSD